jgi:hypothetical protein
LLAAGQPESAFSKLARSFASQSPPFSITEKGFAFQQAPNIIRDFTFTINFSSALQQPHNTKLTSTMQFSVPIEILRYFYSLSADR